MDNYKGKSLITKKDMDDQPIWMFDGDDDLAYPIFRFDDIPLDINPYDLCLRASFIDPFGEKYQGYIVGIKNIYCIVIFWNNTQLFFNKNLLEMCFRNLDEMNSLSDKKSSYKDFFPLSYITTINVEGFNNIEGEFDIFKEITDEERTGI